MTLKFLRLFALLALSHAPSWASDLSDTLQSDDYVLLMRHAHAPGVGDPPGFSLERCETQRQLDAQGMAQAARTGEWQRQQGVRSARVLSSIWCRCRQTAEQLNLGPIEVEPTLASFFDAPGSGREQNLLLQRRIAEALRTKGQQALILVTHHVNIREFMGADVGSGDMVLARVSPQGRLLEHRRYPSP